jgi:hypothetical protein
LRHYRFCTAKEVGRIGVYSNALVTRFNGVFPDVYGLVEDEVVEIEGA